MKKQFLMVSVIVLVWLSIFTMGFNEDHHHMVKDLELHAVKITEVKNAKIFYVDLEEANKDIISIHNIEVAKDFRIRELTEEKEGFVKVLGLGALENSKGILTTCKVCGRAVSMLKSNNLRESL